LYKYFITIQSYKIRAKRKTPLSLTLLAAFGKGAFDKLFFGYESRINVVDSGLLPIFSKDAKIILNLPVVKMNCMYFTWDSATPKC